MYFNYSTFLPSNYWERRSFWRAWWRLYDGDQQGAPPAYHPLSRLVRDPVHPLLARLMTQSLYMEALPRRVTNTNFNPTAPVTSAISFEEAVAATLLQLDRRRQDGAGYLGLLRYANDEESLERLLAKALEHLGEQGATHLIGPTGLLPSWQAGALVSHFNRTPPWHTPYHPPYAGDLLETVMEPWLETRLYSAAVRSVLPPAPAPALLEPLPLSRLAEDLLPLLVASMATDDAFPPCDALEAQTLLHWLQTTLPPQAWLATVEGSPAGFVMLQPDLAPLLRRSGGGRSWVGRGYLALRKNSPARAGRLLLGCVDPAWRGRGIGLQLWRHVMALAAQAGWETITCGPLTPSAPGAAFLRRQGAQPEQRYVIYRWSPG